MGYISPAPDYAGIAISVLALFVVSLLSGYIPAWQVAKEEILDAMRG
jgi:ABC-type antimicrobial peptide transport system permease subunit